MPQRQFRREPRYKLHLLGASGYQRIDQKVGIEVNHDLRCENRSVASLSRIAHGLLPLRGLLRRDAGNLLQLSKDGKEIRAGRRGKRLLRGAHRAGDSLFRRNGPQFGQILQAVRRVFVQFNRQGGTVHNSSFAASLSRATQEPHKRED